MFLLDASSASASDSFTSLSASSARTLLGIQRPAIRPTTFESESESEAEAESAVARSTALTHTPRPTPLDARVSATSSISSLARFRPLFFRAFGPRRRPPPPRFVFFVRVAFVFTRVVVIVRTAFALATSPAIELALDNAFSIDDAPSHPRTARVPIVANAPTTLRLAIAIHRPRRPPRDIDADARAGASASRVDADDADVASNPARSARVVPDIAVVVVDVAV
jgi:hypothetical protein